MRVVTVNGTVDIVIRTKANGRHVFERKTFRGICVAGETEEQIVKNFRYFKVTTDKDLRIKLKEKEDAGKIKLVCFSIETVCGLWGIPPGYSVVEKIPVLIPGN